MPETIEATLREVARCTKDNIRINTFMRREERPALDTWDPLLVATPMQAMLAVVIGPDYFERVQGANTSATTSTPNTTTTTVG